MNVAMLYRVTFASVGSIICVVQNKQYFFSPIVKLFQANETFSEQYKHVKMDYTNVATFFVAMTLNGYIGH